MEFKINDFIKEKIRVGRNKLLSTYEKKLLDIHPFYIENCEYKKGYNLPGDDAPWREFSAGTRLHGYDNHFWFKFTIEPQEKQEGHELILNVKTGKEGQWDATNPQCMLYLDGKLTQAFDTNHTWFPLEWGKKYEVLIYVYGGMIEGGCNFDFFPYLTARCKAAYDLYFDITVPYEVLCELDIRSYEYIQIRDELDKALMLIDFRRIGSKENIESYKAASEYLKTNLYDKYSNPDAPLVWCIGHTHIDVAWRWTVEQTKEKAERSFSTVLSLMERYPEYKFMTSQPQLLQFIKDYNPEMFKKIKQRVKEGRFELEGAMWLEADCNLASGEALVRQILHGKRFLRDEFDVESKILWLPDVFGYSGALPQILKKSGVDKFFTTKLYWNESNQIPNDTFIWQGIDGSEVLATLIPSYVMRLSAWATRNEWQAYKNKSLSKNVIATVGFGDGGGGTSAEMIEFGKRLRGGLPGMPRVEWHRAGEFFDALEKDFKKNTAELKNTPKWSGELYLEMHRGTYTSIAKNKKNNRKSEFLYQSAETLSALDAVLLGGKYDKDTFDKNWKIILLDQFHDILPGSSIREVYEDTDRDYALVLSEGRRIADEKLKRISESIKTDGGILVYNPSPYMQSDFVALDGKTYYAENIPSHGYKVISANESKNSVKISELCLENELIRVTFDEKYQIISIYDKEEEREIIANGAIANLLEAYEDMPREYDAWEITNYYKQKKWICDDLTSSEMTENGFKITRKYGDSTIIQTISLRSRSKRIDFFTTVDWKEDHILLRAAFPLDIHSSYATYDIQFGNIERPTHKNTSWDAAKFEVCAHKWADLSENGYGVSLLNDCKYGYSCEENLLSISLLKSAADPYPEADRHIHEFTYSLYPHVGDFREGGTVKESYLINMPLEAMVQMANEGNLPEEYSFVSCENNNIALETVKIAEDDDSVIVRLFDTFNRKSKAKINTGFDFKEVYICDLMENCEKKLEACGRNVTVPVGNFEIVTLRFII
ncbi:MAG: alpha-mannosidase [Clostridia bacterium]|nr:alpha-mannosidase [Clostridia bacterium]